MRKYTIFVEYYKCLLVFVVRYRYCCKIYIRYPLEFDGAKNNARKAIDETHRELPPYMQTVTDNQEQTVNATRDIMDNYIESQRDITNSFQSAWSSFFDNYFRFLSFSCFYIIVSYLF